MNSSFRHLVIIQGDNHSILKQFNYLVSHIDGDWITVTNDALLAAQAKSHYLPNQTKLLLGREFMHAIFDARCGFNLDALAILSGCLVAKSMLFLLLPTDLENWQDQDSLRWSELSSPLAVPNFLTHLKMVIAQQKQSIDCKFVTQNHADNYLVSSLNLQTLNLHSTAYFDYRQQQALLNNLITLNAKIVLVTAKRGRGKSALAGMFAHHHPCIVTAPNKNAVNTLMSFAPSDTDFFAPDELIMLLKTQQVNPNRWLIIDEAAMIPLPMLRLLIDKFEHVLLCSTLDGYEGTGQGLLLKLLNQYRQQTNICCFELTRPIRWLTNDPLEFFIDHLIMADCHKTILEKSANQVMIKSISQSELVQEPTKLIQFFGLLKAAHYRTTLIDLRRLLDAQNIQLYSAQLGQANIVGVLVTIKEGGLDESLIDQILKGYRRPKGNLVAQSLVAHGGEPLAAKLHSIRINRIAVYEALRSQGIATKLLNQFIMQVKLAQYDYISVSFAYSAELCAFWCKQGFKIVHVGSHKEASTGSYAIMAIYPITTAGYELCHKSAQKLSRNWFWLKSIIGIDLPILIEHDQTLNASDYVELQLFATTSYAYSASLAVLCRLVYSVKTTQPTLIAMLPLLLNLADHHFNEQLTITDFQLSGKKALLMILRKEVHYFLIEQGFINE